MAVLVSVKIGVEEGIPFEEIFTKYYPQLSQDDIKACIAYARQIVQNEDVHLVSELAV